MNLQTRRGLLPRYTLKDANTVLLADAWVTFRAATMVCSRTTRAVLSRLELAIAGRRPSLLGAAIIRTTRCSRHIHEPAPGGLGAVALTARRHSYRA